MKHKAKAKALNSLAHFVKKLSPDELKKHAEDYTKLPPEEERNYPRDLVPENYDYFNDQETGDEQSDEIEEKLKRYAAYKKAPILK